MTGASLGIVTGASLFNILLAHSYFNSPGVRCCVLLRPALPRSLFAIVLQALEISFACPAARRRYLAFICRLSRCNSMGAMKVSASRTSTGVALNAPVTVRKHTLGYLSKTEIIKSFLCTEVSPTRGRLRSGRQRRQCRRCGSGRWRRIV